MLYEEIRYPFVNQDEDVEMPEEPEGPEETGETPVEGDEGEAEEV